MHLSTDIGLYENDVWRPFYVYDDSCNEIMIHLFWPQMVGRFLYIQVKNTASTAIQERKRSL